MKLRLVIEEEVKMCGADEFAGVLADMKKELKSEGLMDFIKGNISDGAEAELTVTGV